MRLDLTALLLASAALPAAAQDRPHVLPEITLEAESDETLTQSGYVATISRQATRLDTPVAEIPQAISIVTQDQIEDQRPRTLNETLGYTASANPNNYGYDTRFDAFTLRGFPAFYNGVFRDGLRVYNAPTAIWKTEPYGTEGIAILKGPASSLYGVSGPGGIVNIVTKRPKDQPFREIEATTGANDRAQIAADWSGPLRDDRLSYRLTGLVRKSGTDLPGYDDDKTYLAPALRFDDGTTRVTLLAEWSRSVTGGTAAFYNPAYGVVSDLYEGDPEYNDFRQDQWRLGYEVEHRLSGSLTLRHSARVSQVDVDLEYSGHYPAGAGLARYWGHYLEKVDSATADTALQWNGATGPVDHELLAGIDLTRAEYRAHSLIGYVSAADTAAGDVPFSDAQETTQAGIYLHDQMSFGNWNAFASLRFDKVDTDSTAADGSVEATEDSGRSGRLGVSYRWDSGLVAYANVSTSFAPNLGLVYDDVTSDIGRPARPTRATQREVGLKYAPEGGNLLLTASVFDIDQRDGVVLDASSGRNRQRQLDLNSRGVELEAMANWDNGLGMIASWTHQRLKIEEGAAGTVGHELSGTPNDILSLWGKYDIRQGSLAGLGLGAGIRHVGESYGDDRNTLTNDARTFVDLQVSYDVPQAPGVQMQMNVKNAFDRQEDICTAGYCYRDEGRVWTASLRRRF
ncbi:TonB-dependent siderophore receptor [Paracoccus luteus]|uniref:TonB-dependent siderophore receptor n=1 Tax=Paracoccus luteus TaxID=2508543 RepID=UPI00106F5140|nr:TonB-dependent siderophore receptor [Paracoccus luteus]